MLLRRLLLILIVLPISVGLVMLAVANRHSVQLVADPFGADPAFTLDAPLFLVVFGALIAGVVLGGVAVWLSQGRWRRAARRSAREARNANAQVEALRAAAVPPAPARPGLPFGPEPRALADRRDAA